MLVIYSIAKLQELYLSTKITRRRGLMLADPSVSGFFDCFVDQASGAVVITVDSHMRPSFLLGMEAQHREEALASCGT